MDQLLRILEELHPDVDFTTHTALIDEGVLDSFDIITLIAEINEEFGVAIPADKIVPENFNSAQAIMALIESLEDE